jgi:hypothetical protein
VTSARPAGVAFLTIPRHGRGGRGRGEKAAVLVREAVAEYVARHAPARRPKSLGKFSSGRHDLGERAEDLLAGMGRPR